MNKIIIAALVLLASTNSQAQFPAPGNPTAPSPTLDPSANTNMLNPQQTIQQGVERLQSFISGRVAADPALVQSFIQTEIAPYFDFATMTRLILGPLEYQLTPKQQYAARIMIRNQFLAALANNLMSYRGGRVDYLNVSGNLGMGQVKVRLRIYQPGKYPLALELRIARNYDGWKIYDVAANGVSAVAHYRNYVQSVIMRSGPQGLLQP